MTEENYSKIEELKRLMDIVREGKIEHLPQAKEVSRLIDELISSGV